MRKKHNLLFTLTLAFSLVSISMLGIGKEEYRKSFNKSYNVAKDVTVKTNTSFGDIRFKVWDKQEVQVDVEVYVEAKSEEKANDIFDRVTVNLIGSSSKIEVSTELRNLNNGGDSYSIEIQVTIQMPATGSIDVEHSFGDLDVESLVGQCLVDLSYGDMDAKALTNNNNRIKVEFGDGDIELCGGGKIAIAYGDMDVERIEGDVYLSCEYGDLEIDMITADCRFLDISTEFGDTDVDIASGANFRVEADASFGDVDLPSGFIIDSKSEEMTSSHISGWIGSKDTKGKIKANCSFGDITIRIR